MRRTACSLTACGAAALVLLLAGCERVDGNPNAPGSPGDNAARVVEPAVPDGPPGGPSGIVGSLPHPGASGGDPVPASTGSGEPAPTGAHSKIGVGLDGGLSPGSAVEGTTRITGPTSAPDGGPGPGAVDGSPNVMGGVGQR